MKTTTIEEKKEAIQKLIEIGFLISENVLEKLTDEVLYNIQKEGITEDTLIKLGLKNKTKQEEKVNINNNQKIQTKNKINNQHTEEQSINKNKLKADTENIKSVDNNKIKAAADDDCNIDNNNNKLEQKQINEINTHKPQTFKNNVYDEKKLKQYKIKILDNYNKSPEKKDVADFVGYFYSRFKQIQEILIENTKLEDAVGILRMSGKKNIEVSFIGMIYNKEETKNGNCIITMEDMTGSIKVLVNKNNKKLYKKSKDLVLDEVIGIKGKIDDKIVFAEDIIFATEEDELSKKQLKQYYKETYGVFISDLHIGANSTKEEKLEKFVQWINGEKGTEEHKSITKKIKYLFIVGDVVEGIGVYPDQEKELLDKDINKQYQKVLSLLKKISKDIAIIIIPGNHDAIRLAEPQTPLNNNKHSRCLLELDNVFLISNPSSINILHEQDFEGFNMLLYHGYGFDHYFSDVNSIRSNGGYERGDLLLKFLLKKRHLSPTYDSTLLMPEKEKDSLVIENIPDFFITGHTHRVFVENYNNITIMSSGTFQEQTEFQKKFGHIPDVSKIVLTNFMTRENRILKF